jgi:uroporphyrinogen decarboxylase
MKRVIAIPSAEDTDLHQLSSRQRVLMAVSHQDTDRVPVDYFVRRDVTNRLVKYLSLPSVEDLYVKLGIDFRKIPIKETIPRFEQRANGILGGSSEKSGEKYIFHPDGTYEDGWGIVHRQGRDGLYDQWISGPFAHSDDLDSFDWPSMDIFEPVADIKKKVDAFGGQYALIGRLNLPFKVAWFMRGFENYLCDMMTDPDFARELSRRSAAYEIEKGVRLIQAGVDIIGIYGDIAMQDRMLVNPEAWRDIEKPIMADMITRFKALNPKIILFYHSDGDLSEVMPDLIEIGVDMINPIQPECMDVARVKRDYGDKITLHGTVSIQKTLPHGSVEDVRNEIMDRIRLCGQNGGLVICPANHVQNDTPLENLLEVYRASGSFVE